jgi:cell division septal protein FtsQ
MGKKNKKPLSFKISTKQLHTLGRGALWMTYRVLPLTLVILVGWFGFQTVRADLLQDPFFRLKTIDVQTDGVLTPAQVLPPLGLQKNMTLFDVSLRDVARGLKAMPRIRKFTVYKHFPDTLVIRLEERKPVFQLRLIGRTHSFLVDTDGILFKFSDSIQPNLLIVEDDLQTSKTLRLGKNYPFHHLQSVLSVYALAKDNTMLKNEKIEKVAIDSLSNLSLFLDDKLELKVGRENISERLGKLNSVENLLHDKKERQNVRYIDLRFEDVIVRYK